MNNQQIVQYAVMCLQELDEHASQFVSSHQISKRQGIPHATCVAILEKLSQAGLVESVDPKHYALRTPVEELKVLDILQALYAEQPKRQPAFRLVFAPQKSARPKTLEIVRWSQALEAYPSEDGVQG